MIFSVRTIAPADQVMIGFPDSKKSFNNLCIPKKMKRFLRTAAWPPVMIRAWAWFSCSLSFLWYLWAEGCVQACCSFGNRLRMLSRAESMSSSQSLTFLKASSSSCSNDGFELANVLYFFQISMTTRRSQLKDLDWIRNLHFLQWNSMISAQHSLRDP